jgi:acyl carrier protein
VDTRSRDQSGEAGNIVTQEQVLAEIVVMLRTVLDGYDIDDTEITMDTTFGEHLEMESIDLVALGGLLTERYGDRVNFAEFVAGLGLDEIIGLTVGRLVDHVVAANRSLV